LPSLVTLTEETLSDVNETTIQQLADELNETRNCLEGPEARAARIRRVFQSATRERAPILARLLTNHNPTQPITRQ
jgi:hypothetical protein